MSVHKISLGKIEARNATPYGSRTSVTKANFPVLQGMALYQLLIEEGCFREPHWHPNADELGYCTDGHALITIFSSGNQHDQFSIHEGEMFFVPSGSIHSIENIGNGRSVFILSFSSDSPEDFGLSGSVGCMSLEVMGNTWGQKAADLGKLTRSVEDIIFEKVSGKPEVPASAAFANRLKFSLESKAPSILTEYGFARLARKETWPVLRSQGMYSLRMHGTGMREPHWHPETAELGYVKEGHARMTIKSPGNKVDTYTLEPGDTYFIPRAYPHHIENLTDGELHFLIFFDTPNVQDIGYTGGIPAFPHRIVGPTLGIESLQIFAIPDLPMDELIVKKTNPVA
jgi:oxalate decarboxylase